MTPQPMSRREVALIALAALLFLVFLASFRTEEGQGRLYQKLITEPGSWR